MAYARFALAGLILCLAAGLAVADDEDDEEAPGPAPHVAAAEPRTPDVPSGSLFGFTSGTEIGEPGDRSFSTDLNARLGKPGRYRAGSVEVQYSQVLTQQFAFAVTAFGAYHRLAGVPGADDRNRIGFDGVSGELLWELFDRDYGPLSATVAVEPRYQRFDAGPGTRATAYSAEFKLYVDAVLVPDRLFAAVNLIYAPGIARREAPDPGHVAGSTLTLSAALAYQATSKLFLSGEMRLLGSFRGGFLNERLGYAVFAGPALFYKVSDTVALSLAWTPQLFGRDKGSPGRLDLDNFERQQFRARLAYSF